jgi:sphingosine-1-phosphate phosphatase 1
MLSNIRKALLPLVTSSTSNGIVLKFQRLCGVSRKGQKVGKVVSNVFLYTYFKLASTAGDEVFIFIPFLFWFAADVSGSFISNFCSLLITGQVIKDLLMLPRPPSSEVIKLETQYETEYGLPSSHSMSALMPFVLCFAWQRKGYLVGLHFWLFSTIYALSVALSRMYMGVHSPLDIIAGWLLGALVVSTLHVIGDSIDLVLYESPLGVAVILVCVAAFVRLYPRARHWSASYGTAATIFGVWTGAALGLWYIHNIDRRLLQILQESSSFPYPDSAVENSAPAAMLFTLVTALPSNIRATVVIVSIKIAIAAPVCVIALLTGKIVGTIVFMSLLQQGIISRSVDESKDTMGRSVPSRKAYNVDIPIRLDMLHFLPTQYKL